MTCPICLLNQCATPTYCTRKYLEMEYQNAYQRLQAQTLGSILEHWTQDDNLSDLDVVVEYLLQLECLQTEFANECAKFRPNITPHFIQRVKNQKALI